MLVKGAHDTDLGLHRMTSWHGNSFWNYWLLWIHLSTTTQRARDVEFSCLLLARISFCTGSRVPCDLRCRDTHVTSLRLRLSHAFAHRYLIFMVLDINLNPDFLDQYSSSSAFPFIFSSSSQTLPTSSSFLSSTFTVIIIIIIVIIIIITLSSSSSWSSSSVASSSLLPSSSSSHHYHHHHRHGHHHQ